MLFVVGLLLSLRFVGCLSACLLSAVSPRLLYEYALLYFALLCVVLCGLRLNSGNITPHSCQRVEPDAMLIF